MPRPFCFQPRFLLLLSLSAAKAAANVPPCMYSKISIICTCVQSPSIMLRV